MYRLGINIPERNLEQYRANDYLNKEFNVLHDRKKVLKREIPRPDRFFTPIPEIDNRDTQLEKLRKEMDEKLEINVPERRK